MTLHHTFAVLSNNPLKPFGPSHRILRSLERLKACNRPSLVEHINADGHGEIPLRQIADEVAALLRIRHFATGASGTTKLGRVPYPHRRAIRTLSAGWCLSSSNVPRSPMNSR